MSVLTTLLCRPLQQRVYRKPTQNVHWSYIIIKWFRLAIKTVILRVSRLFFCAHFLCISFICFDKSWPNVACVPCLSWLDARCAERLGFSLKLYVQDVYDKIFETRSRRSQFISRINALAISKYYSKRNTDNKGILCFSFYRSML